MPAQSVLYWAVLDDGKVNASKIRGDLAEMASVATVAREVQRYSVEIHHKARPQRRIALERSTREMLARHAGESSLVRQSDFFAPVHFRDALGFPSPVFEMGSHAEWADDMRRAILQVTHREHVQMVVMVVRENEQIERRNVAGLIEVGSCERLEKAAQWETGVQSGVDGNRETGKFQVKA